MTGRGSRARGRRSRLHLLVAAAATAVVVGSLGLLAHRSRETETASSVATQIRVIALDGGRHPDAGGIGPWIIAAEAADPATGDLTNFRVTSGSVLIAAAKARIVVDPVRDTFSFELWDAVYTRIAPAADEGDDGHDRFLHTIDHFVLGPVPYGVDIVPDPRKKGSRDEGTEGRREETAVAD